jgi:hypothetical protein
VTQRIGSNRIANTSVTGLKVADNSIRGNNIVAGQITGNLIGTGAIGTNNIVAGAITGNLIGTGAITGNLISDSAVGTNNIVAGAITGNLIGTGAINSNHIADLAVTGNEIGLNSISSNNFTSNLQLNIVRVIESANISTIPASGNINISLSNNSIHYFLANTTGNCTFNLRANSTTRLDAAIANGQAATVAVLLTQGSTQYLANIYIDDVLQTSNVKWMGNTRPTYNASITNSLVDVYTLTTIKTGSNSYTILASNTIFGTA